MVAKVPFIGATRPSRPRNAFDLSQRHMFTASAGMLLPILSLDLLPNDNVKINARDFMRALPMNSNAFVSMRSVYEFFFVPYHQLWTPFDQFITGMTDFKSTLVKNAYTNGHSNLNVHPYLYLNKLRELIDADVAGGAAKTLDGLGLPLVYGSNRLLDLLGYGAHRDVKFGETRHTRATIKPDTDIKVSPWRILAYNKIYSDFYRNTSYEPYDVSSFNVDDVVTDSTTGTTESIFKRSLKLRYRNAGLDLLTNVRPTLNISAYNGLTTPDTVGLYLEHGRPTSLAMPNDRLLNGQQGTELVMEGQNKESEYIGNVVTKTTKVDVSLNLRSLRSAFAFDKLIDITNRAGKTFEEQMLAHFGVKIPESRDGRCTYIGGFDSQFSNDDVTQTSGSTFEPKSGSLGVEMAGYLGRVAGKSLSSGSGSINFTAREHGVLMCIYSLVPELTYDSTRVDPMVEKIKRFDYFTPEYENLGLQPIKARSLSYYCTSGDWAIGYQPRYSEYKTAIDINHGQFIDNQPLSYWSSHRLYGNFSSYNATHLKINPHSLDWIFPVQADGLEVHDQFFGGCNFNIIKVSDMSVDGLPTV